MNTAKLTSLLTAACAATLIAANAPNATQLQGYPKNIARQHYATNVFLFDAASGRYVATEAAAAWLDDDVTTGWPALAGKQHYMVQFAEPQLVNNLALSTRPTQGKVTIYAGDTAAAPGEPGWTAIAKDVELSTINNKKLAKPLNRFAKYVLIETNIADPGPIYGLYIYGDKAAATEKIVKRTQAVDIRTVHGEFVNNQTSFNIAGLYANGRVTYVNGTANTVSWQRAIDDNPESSVALAPSTNESGLIVKFDAPHPVSRLSLLSDTTAKGKVDIFLLAQSPEMNQPLSIEGLTPSVTLTFDGSTPRTSADIAETSSTAMVLRWTPEAGTDPIAIREINVFADLSLADYEVSGTPTAIAQSPEAIKAEEEAATKESSDGKTVADGKSLAPVAQGKSVKEIKNVVPPVLAGPGYRPGLIGFPPNIVVRPPNSPPAVSP